MFETTCNVLLQYIFILLYGLIMTIGIGGNIMVIFTVLRWGQHYISVYGWINIHHHIGAVRCRPGPTCTSATWRCLTSSSAAWRPPWRPSRPSPGPGTWAPSSAASSPLSRSLDDWWCHNWRMMFQCTSVYMSTMSLTAVAVDRCMAVSTSPVPYNRCCDSSKRSILVTITYSQAGWRCESCCCDHLCAGHGGHAGQSPLQPPHDPQGGTVLGGLAGALQAAVRSVPVHLPVQCPDSGEQRGLHHDHQQARHQRGVTKRRGGGLTNKPKYYSNF